MFAQGSEERQEREAEDGEVIAFDLLEQLHARPLEPEDANAELTSGQSASR